MRTRHWVLAAAALSWSALAPAQVPSVGPAETVDAFHFALKAGNRQMALELLTADFLMFEQGKVERTRTEYARRHLGEDIAFAGITNRVVLRRTTKLLGNAAWVMSINRNRGKINNRPVDFVTTETVVLNKIGNKWRIVHIHWSFDEKTPTPP